MKKVELLHTAQTQHRREKGRTRVSSNTKEILTKEDKEIEDLKNQTKLLKQDPRQHDT